MPPKKFRLFLASGSPRRKEILSQVQILCSVFSSNSSELFDENLTLEANLRKLAKTKVQAVVKKLSLQNKKGIIILGADTVVCVGKTVLGKPKSSIDAARMLRFLSGKTHSVKTSFCLFCPEQDKWVTRVVTTKVGFRKLSKEDVRWYVNSGEPFDKAGAYAIQGLAQHFVNVVRGDFLNVVGLPINAVRGELRKNRWNVEISKRRR